MLIEICVQGIESVAAAADGRAHRIELCEALNVGGVTPSHGMIAEAVETFANPVHVLIRPRAGNFLFTDRELRVMLKDIEQAGRLGAQGVVLGALDAAGLVDRPKMATMIKAAGPMEVAFHRAFDLITDWSAALEQLIELKTHRILTAGGAATARDGVDRLAALQRQAGDRLIILAGGRVTENDLAPFAACGLDEAHIGSSAQQAGRTDAGRIRQLVNAAESLTHLR